MGEITFWERAGRLLGKLRIDAHRDSKAMQRVKFTLMLLLVIALLPLSMVWDAVLHAMEILGQAVDVGMEVWS